MIFRPISHHRLTAIKISLLTALLLAVPLSSRAEWQPPGAETQYIEILSRVRDGEGYTGFLAAEKDLIKNSGPEYFSARWKFLMAVDGAKVATPEPRVVKEFLDTCINKKWLAQNDLPRFRTATICLGKELIIDQSSFSIPLQHIHATRNIPYANYGTYRTKADFFRPEKTWDKPLPCIVFIHCGGWEVHKRAWFESHARVAAREGFAAFNIDYRLLPGVTPADCVHDAKAAVRFVRANATKYGIDPDRIGVFGASAGAQLATLLATSADDKSLEGPGGNPETSSKVQACVAFATPALTGRRTWPLGKSGPLPAWFKKISPYEHAGPGDAPMLLIHGAKDSVVSLEEPHDLQKKLTAAGVPCTVEIVPNGGHVCYMSEEMSMKAVAFFRKNL